MSIRNNGRRKRASKKRYQCSFSKEMTDPKSILAHNEERAAEMFFTNHLIDKYLHEDRGKTIADVYVLCPSGCVYWIVVDSALILDVSVVRVKLL